MKRLPLLIAAAAAWWLYTRSHAARAAPPELAAASSVFTHAGRTYRVVGSPTAEGLVPVQYQPSAGSLAAAVVRYYDPATGTIVAQPGALVE